MVAVEYVAGSCYCDPPYADDVLRSAVAADPTHLIQAILLLEHAQKSSTMNHYFRLLLIRIYRLLGQYNTLASRPRLPAS